MSSPRKPPPPKLELAGIDDASQTTNQEAVPLTYVAGEAVVALQWISPIYNQRAVEAPAESTGKK